MEEVKLPVKQTIKEEIIKKNMSTIGQQQDESHESSSEEEEESEDE